MPAAQHQRDGGFFHPRDQLRNGKPRLDIPADRVEQQQQPVNFLAFLHGREQGNDVLIFCRLLRIRRKGVPLDRADDRQAVDGVAALRRRHNAILGDQIVLQTLQRGVFGGV